MNEIRLSQRLQSVADFVSKGARVADIGSDHAYLPAYLVQEGTIDFAVAGEVVEGPFNIAKNHINDINLHNKIDVRLANGLAAIEKDDQIDNIVIAGMGGILISEILGADIKKLKQVKRLILQPNNHEDTLRQWLDNQGFKIVDEKILLEAGKFYEIIVAESTDCFTENSVSTDGRLSVKELIFGPKLLLEKSDIFCKKWEKERDTLNKILKRLPEEQVIKRVELQEQKQKIEEILK
ncbi:tRNA (adenine(22)-N(1))-methyltransferase [Lactococcus allomyrinae]|uniref:tRNA (Adenine-N(1))-methyltransferase n=1 Tax=Lactococcus allomyrinae TaxID=2419773 RepID=A0A387B940_9LACT|nr:tRNA (adenine(22)-N(1))-methyltransferase TrmK [Lactococcus allomyrinae]AYG00223.1 tRNA (adenine-N(1))-methyltransferase [Lactococcus allomyrinae]